MHVMECQMLYFLKSYKLQIKYVPHTLTHTERDTHTLTDRHTHTHWQTHTHSHTIKDKLEVTITYFQS